MGRRRNTPHGGPALSHVPTRHDSCSEVTSRKTHRRWGCRQVDAATRRPWASAYPELKLMTAGGVARFPPSSETAQTMQGPGCAVSKIRGGVLAPTASVRVVGARVHRARPTISLGRKDEGIHGGGEGSRQCITRLWCCEAPWVCRSARAGRARQEAFLRDYLPRRLSGRGGQGCADPWGGGGGSGGPPQAKPPTHPRPKIFPSAKKERPILGTQTPFCPHTHPPIPPPVQ